MYLVVDTETHDLPRNWRAPVTNLRNWPRVVQAAWLEFDSEGHETGRYFTLVRPDGFEIAAGAQKVHGISTAVAARHGVALAPILDAFAAAVARSKVVIAHNIDFDATVLSAELLRAGKSDVLAEKTLFCTMKASAEYCNLPGNFGPKWPKLEELYTHVFASQMRTAHDALADAEACARCFFELKRRGVRPFASA